MLIRVRVMLCMNVMLCMCARYVLYVGLAMYDMFVGYVCAYVVCVCYSMLRYV